MKLTFEDRTKAYFRQSFGESQVQGLKALYNSTSAFTLHVRGVAASPLLERKNTLVNLYHASIQKTGSTWLSALISDQRIQRFSSLRPFPQFRYEWGGFRKRFPKFTYVPGLYISYGLYEEILKPRSFSTIYVVRDPREVLVSWYYSTKDTHALMGKVIKDRPILQKLNTEDGLRYSIEQLQLKFAFVRSWVYGAQWDSSVNVYKFEDLTAKPYESVPRLLRDVGIHVPSDILEEVIRDFGFERMRERDVMTRRRVEGSHYRKDRKPWREVLSSANLELLNKNIGDLVELLGYDVK